MLSFSTTMQTAVIPSYSYSFAFSVPLIVVIHRVQQADQACDVSFRPCRVPGNNHKQIRHLTMVVDYYGCPPLYNCVASVLYFFWPFTYVKKMVLK